MSVRKDFVRGGEAVRVSCEPGGEGRFRVQIGEDVHEIAGHLLPDGRIAFRMAGELHTAAVAPAKDGALHVRVDGRTFTLRPHRGRGAVGGGAGTGVLLAPMTGTLLDVFVAVGEQVTRGTTVALLSAMKMEHKIVADVDGTVAEIGAKSGEQADQGCLLVRIEPDQGTA
jgi:biotin carboxyl carrier protein